MKKKTKKKLTRGAANASLVKRGKKPLRSAAPKKASKKKAAPVGAWCVDAKSLATIKNQIRMQKARLARVSSMLTRRAAKASRGSRYLALTNADKAKLAAVGLHVDELLSSCRQFRS